MTKVLVQYERETPLPPWVTPNVLKAMHEKDGKSLRQLGREFGVSHETIRNLIKKAQ